MEIKLKSIQKEEKKYLSNLIKEYQSEILDESSEYKYLDSYWEKPDRHAYFITIGSEVVGFVLINKHTFVAKKSYSISEFYIKKDWRNLGIGKKTAIMIFDLFRGKWEIREIDNNKSAQQFWRKVIGEYTNNKFEEHVFANADWSGPIQIFESTD